MVWGMAGGWEGITPLMSFLPKCLLTNKLRTQLGALSLTLTLSHKHTHAHSQSGTTLQTIYCALVGLAGSCQVEERGFHLIERDLEYRPVYKLHLKQQSKERVWFLVRSSVVYKESGGGLGSQTQSIATDHCSSSVKSVVYVQIMVNGFQLLDLLTLCICNVICCKGSLTLLNKHTLGQNRTYRVFCYRCIR